MSFTFEIMKNFLLVAFCMKCVYAARVYFVNDTIVLPCICDNNSTVDWIRADDDNNFLNSVVRIDDVVSEYRSRASLLVSDTHKNLSLQQVQLSDSGVYICYMQTKHSYEMHTEINLVVMNPFTVGHDVHTTVGDTANLTCGLDGVYEWWHVNNNWMRTADYPQNSLIILNTRLYDSGMYVCRSNNESYTIHLYVHSGSASNSILVTTFIAIVVVQFVAS